MLEMRKNIPRKPNLRAGEGGADLIYQPFQNLISCQQNAFELMNLEPSKLRILINPTLLRRLSPSLHNPFFSQYFSLVYDVLIKAAFDSHLQNFSGKSVVFGEVGTFWTEVACHTLSHLFQPKPLLKGEGGGGKEIINIMIRKKSKSLETEKTQLTFPFSRFLLIIRPPLTAGSLKYVITG